MPIAQKIVGIVESVQITESVIICAEHCFTTKRSDDDNNDDIDCFYHKWSAVLAID